ncbi:MAG: 50S ribosomal protein L3 [Anaerolineales bacterium]|nr:50S ribosomal protein L3 [Anaerolineae bacterium]PWB77224.1 MAG: 50S ribosomal protein L3 [Anaerolineales bacterium]
MLKGLIGKKIGMTQIFDEQGVAHPVTIIEAGPCYVTQIRRPEKEGYAAVQLGYGEVHPKRLSSGELGHLNSKDLPPMRFLREFRSKETVNVGDKLTVEVFAVGERVDVVGTSKGKGFAGAVKRHHFAGGKKTHGQSDRHRAPGSRSSGTTPGRVFKGSRGAGHMGSDRVTVAALKIVMLDAERNLIGVNGAVPGGKGGLVLIKEARKQ